MATLADHLGLSVPARRVVTLAADTPTDDHNDELADLLRASVGENLGFRYLPTARPLHLRELPRLSHDFASQVRWLDWLVLNPDRSPANPNILMDGSHFWLIDHGAALHFQHDWPAVTERSPHRPDPPHAHLFDEMATRLREWDPLLTSLVSRPVLEAAVDEVPASFLLPLLPPGSPLPELERRRAAYVAFLRKRLEGPRPWAPSGPERPAIT